MKQCNRCKEVKSLTEYYVRKSESRPLPYCKPCSREIVRLNYEADPVRAKALQAAQRERSAERIKRKGLLERLAIYGLSEKDYLGLLEQQGHVCAICGKASSTVYIDHCHATGKVRGILCNTCNLGLGMLGDTAEALQKATDYLKRFEGSVVLTEIAS